MSDTRAARARIKRLVALWLVAAVIVGGCASAKRAGLADRTDTPSLIAALLMFLIALAALGIASWRDPRNRGTYLGIVFGTLAEIVIIRRVPVDYYQNLVIAGFVILALIAVQRLWPSGTFAAPSTSSALTAAEEQTHSIRPGPAPVDAPPRTGLVAFIATVILLLAFDMTIQLF